jgi:hypothetical protein
MKDATPGWIEYTAYNSRGIVHLGRFEYPKDGYRVGQEILVEKTCKYTETFLTDIVESVEISYTFNDTPVYRVWTRYGSGGWLSPLVHVSLYDSIVKVVPENDFLKNWNAKRASLKAFEGERQAIDRRSQAFARRMRNLEESYRR